MSRVVELEGIETRVASRELLLSLCQPFGEIRNISLTREGHEICNISLPRH